MAIQDRSAAEAAAAVVHPLDPLSPDEVTLAAQVVRDECRLGDRAGFVQINMHEPPKDDVFAFTPGSSMVRRAWVVVIDGADGNVYEGVVNLNDRRVESWEHRTGVQPYPLFEEFARAHEICLEDEGWQAAVRARGIDDLSKVQIDPWPSGNFEFPDEEGRRILRCISYYREEKASNGYARPLEGLVAMVDLVEGRVIRLVDERLAPLPEADLRYNLESIPNVRQDLKPLHISQPDGVSFTLDGHELSWQKWSMRVSLHPREGLVLHQIHLLSRLDGRDGGALRRHERGPVLEERLRQRRSRTRSPDELAIARL
jgi:primary-amine oxidase